MRKKIISFLLLGLASISYSNIELDETSRKEAEKLLENVRKRIQKEEKEAEKRLAEERKKAEELAREREKEKEKLRKEMEEAQARAEKEKIQEEQELMKTTEAGTAAEIEAVAAVENAEQELVVEGETKVKQNKEDIARQYTREKKKLEAEEKAKAKTEIEKLEITQKLVNEKVDFYERVVRSVAREEEELLKHKETLKIGK